MKKIISVVSALALVAAVSAMATAPAEAWHPSHHYGYGYPVGAGVAAGILGFGLGAAIAGSAARDSDYREHVAACLDAYKSYDPRTDTYVGYDGYRHRCRL